MSHAANLQAALSLRGYLVNRNWREGALVGPDSGVRFNYRVGRFVKSYLRSLPWRDDRYYLQAQGYWILANWRLADAEGERIAFECSERVLAAQQPDGAWAYPSPAWRGRVTLYEGSWAATGLLETYRRTGSKRFLDGALRWHAYSEAAIGYQRVGGHRAANYFGNRPGAAVVNASVDAVRFLAELADAAGEAEYATGSRDVTDFIASTQLPSGELPYAVPAAEPTRLPHYQCFQYNAFECLGLLRRAELTADAQASAVAREVLRYLETGLRDDGSARYQCSFSTRRVTYHAAALAAAFARGGQVELAERAFAYVRGRQRPDGSFGHSRGDYLVLSDERAYPRNLAMIMLHLLEPFPD